MNWMDIFLLIVLLKSGLEGFSRGLILSAFKIMGVIVALYVGVFYRDAVVNFLKAHFAIESALSAILFINQAPASKAQAVGAMGAKTITDMALGAVSFFLVFMGVQIIFLITAFFLDSLVKAARLSPVNRLLGFAFGLARSALWIALTYAVLSPFLMVWPESFLTRGFNESYIFTHMKFLDFITPVVIKFI